MWILPGEREQASAGPELQALFPLPAFPLLVLRLLAALSSFPLLAALSRSEEAVSVPLWALISAERPPALLSFHLPIQQLRSPRQPGQHRPHLQAVYGPRQQQTIQLQQWLYPFRSRPGHRLS